MGYGSDFDGVPAANLPVGLEDVSMFPYLTAELIRRGYSEVDVEKIVGNNFLRVLRGAEAAAAAMQASRPSSIVDDTRILPNVTCRSMF